MAFRAKDGRAFGNRQKMQAYNDRSSPKSEPKSKARGESPQEAARERPAAGEDYASEYDPPVDENDIANQNIADVVRSHGPANRIEITHDGDLHNVVSTHGTHVQHSSHPTMAAAHVHAGDAAGLSPDEASTAMGGEGGGEEEEEPSTPNGRRNRNQIPGLRS